MKGSAGQWAKDLRGLGLGGCAENLVEQIAQSLARERHALAGDFGGFADELRWQCDGFICGRIRLLRVGVGLRQGG